MQFKVKLIAVCAVLGVLILSFILGNIFSPEQVQKRSEEKPLFSGIKTANAVSVEISKEGKTVHLAKKGPVWMVKVGDEEFPAENSRIEGFLSAVQKLKRIRVVGSKEDYWKQLGLTAEEASHVVVKDQAGIPIVDIFSGKADPGGKGNYLRTSSAPVSYLVGGSLSSYLGRDEAYWSDLRLFPEDLKGTNIMHLKIQSRKRMDEKDTKSFDGDYTIVKSADKNKRGWIVQSSPGKELDSAAVDSMANALADLNAVQYVPSSETAAAGLDSPFATITVTSDTDKTYTLSLGTMKEENKYYASISNKPYLFAVSKWSVERALKPLSELEKKK